MSDVATEAELSKGTLYLYFENKDSLFLAVSNRLIGTLGSELEALVAQVSTDEEGLRRLVECYTGFVARHPTHFRMAISEVAHMRPRETSSTEFCKHGQAIGRVMNAFASFVRKCQAAGTMGTGVDPVQVALSWWAAMMGNMLIRVNGEELMRRHPLPVDLDKMVPTLVSLLTRGLMGETK